MNPEERKQDVIEDLLREMHEAPEALPPVEMSFASSVNPMTQSSPEGSGSSVYGDKLSTEKSQFIPASSKEVSARVPKVLGGSLLTILFTAIAFFFYLLATYLKIDLELFSIVMLPSQFYLSFCLFRLSSAFFAKQGNYPIHPVLIAICSLISWVLMPTFGSYFELSRQFNPFLLEPNMCVWLATQLAWPFLIANFIQSDSKNGKANYLYSLSVSFAANAYLLTAPFWGDIIMPIPAPNAGAIQVQIIFWTLWYSSQVCTVAYFAEKLRVPSQKVVETKPTVTHVHADDDIVIAYKAFAAIERWRDQQAKTLKKEMRTVLLIALPVMLICYGYGFVLITKSGGISGLVQFFNKTDETTTTPADPGQPLAVAFAGGAPATKGKMPTKGLIPLSNEDLFDKEGALQANSSFLTGLVVLASIIGFYGSLMILKEPTHLGLNRKGWRFLWRRGLQNVNDQYVSWSDMRSIRMVRPKGKTSPLDEILCFTMKTGKVRRLKMGSIESVDSREQVLKAIEKWAPNVERDASVIQALQPAADHSYTELWLQALTAPPQRERLKPLVENMILKDGRYKVIRQLGAGGQGQAYLASDAGNHSEGVVLKEFILPVYVDINVRRSALEQFENEARILRKLDHPRVVKLIDFFVEDHRTYLVLEHLQGGSLRDLIQNETRLQESAVRNLALQMCEILSYLHNLNPPIIHRDFTPDNLIFDAFGKLKLIDFNVAKQVLESTTSGTVVGKHAYLPPEQFRGMPECRSDIYAMGATLHYLLTGQDPEPIATSHPKRVLDTISEEMNRIVERATALDANKRYEKVEDLQRDLAACAVIAS